MSMTKKQIKLVIGSLLHDIGKIVFRSEDEDKTVSHSLLGYEFLKHDIGVSDSEILNAVKLHHECDIKDAQLSKDDISYITYFANKISSYVEYSKKEDNLNKSSPLKTVFNILNNNKNNQEKKYYGSEFINLKGAINYPRDEATSLDKNFYKSILSCIEEIKHDLVKSDYTENDIKKLMSFLEAKLSYVPSDTATHEFADIPLYDHLKITAW
jgi:CRISPR-associated protein Csm1